MHAHKITLFALAAMMTAACTLGPVAGTSNEEADDLRQELAELKEANQALQKQYVSQNEEMTRILNDLAAITGKTANLRLDVENGSARMTQAEQISGSIETLKARIAALEKSNSVVAGKNKEFQKMIEGFNKVIQEQEMQISALKRDIESKESTIRAQKDTIGMQNETIRQQNIALEKKVAEQARMLCDAGVMLEEIADNAPDVSFRKNKEKMGVMVQDIYKKARLYYQKSLEAGYSPAADHLAGINAKIGAE